MMFGELKKIEGKIVWKGKGVEINENDEERKIGIGMVLKNF